MPCEVTPPGEGAAASWPSLSPAMEQQRHASRSNLPPQFRSTTGHAARAAISRWNSVGRAPQLSLERTSKARQRAHTAIPRGRSARIPPNGVDPWLIKRRNMKFSETSPVELGRWHSFRPWLLPPLPAQGGEEFRTDRRVEKEPGFGGRLAGRGPSPRYQYLCPPQNGKED
jgi:hypothetical protein